MGYRGLLLNDPYKRDRMGCVCGYSSCVYFLPIGLTLEIGYMNQERFLEKKP
jgi:hypothetical protein